MTANSTVTVAATLPAVGLDLLRRRFIVEADPDGADNRWLLDHVPGTAAIVADPTIRIDAQVLDCAGQSLAVISNFGVGYDNVDLEAARARGVRVTNTPGVLSNATAELTVTLMLAVARRIVEADAVVRCDRWSDGGARELLGRELVGATVGLVGFGRIAQRVAELLRGFDVRLLFSSRGTAPTLDGAERRGLNELLSDSDFVSLHVPLTQETRHMIGATALSQMKPGGILINTSRGGVLDTGALIESLRLGALAGAGLDVYEDEPDVPAQLRALPNTVLLPHIGSATAATRDAMARVCAENVIAVIEGREPMATVV